MFHAATFQVSAIRSLNQVSTNTFDLAVTCYCFAKKPETIEFIKRIYRVSKLVLMIGLFYLAMGAHIAYIAGVKTRVFYESEVRPLIDGYVDRCLEQPILDEIPSNAVATIPVITPVDAPIEPAIDTPATDAPDYTIRELKGMAKVAKIKNYSRMTKPQLIAALGL